MQRKEYDRETEVEVMARRHGNVSEPTVERQEEQAVCSERGVKAVKGFWVFFLGKSSQTE